MSVFLNSSFAFAPPPQSIPNPPRDYNFTGRYSLKSAFSTPCEIATQPDSVASQSSLPPQSPGPILSADNSRDLSSAGPVVTGRKQGCQMPTVHRRPPEPPQPVSFHSLQQQQATSFQQQFQQKSHIRNHYSSQHFKKHSQHQTQLAPTKQPLRNSRSHTQVKSIACEKFDEIPNGFKSDCTQLIRTSGIRKAISSPIDSRLPVLNNHNNNRCTSRISSDDQMNSNVYPPPSQTPKIQINGQVNGKHSLLSSTIRNQSIDIDRESVINMNYLEQTIKSEQRKPKLAELSPQRIQLDLSGPRRSSQINAVDLDEEDRFVLHLVILTLYKDQIKPQQIEIKHRLQELQCSSFLERNFVSLYELLQEWYIVEKANNLVTIYLKNTPSWFGGWVDMRDTENPYPLHVWLAFDQYLSDMLRASSVTRVRALDEAEDDEEVKELLPPFCSLETRGGRYGMAKRLKLGGPEVFRRYSLGQVCHLVQLAVYTGLLAYDGGSLMPAAGCRSLVRRLYLPVNGNEDNPFNAVPSNVGPSGSPHENFGIINSSKYSHDCDEAGSQYPVVVDLADVLTNLKVLLYEEDNFRPMLLSQLKFRFLHRFKKRLDPVCFGFTRLSDFLSEKCFSICHLIREGGRQVLVDRLSHENLKDLDNKANGAGAGMNQHVEKNGEEKASNRPSTTTTADGVVSECHENTSWNNADVSTDRTTRGLLAVVAKHNRFHSNITFCHWQYCHELKRLRALGASTTTTTTPARSITTFSSPNIESTAHRSPEDKGINYNNNNNTTTTESLHMSGQQSFTPSDTSTTDSATEIERSHSSSQLVVSSKNNQLQLSRGQRIYGHMEDDEILFCPAAQFTDFLFSSVLRPAALEVSSNYCELSPPMPPPVMENELSSPVHPDDFRGSSQVHSSSIASQICRLQWFTRRPLIERQLGNGSPLLNEDVESLQNVFFAVLPPRLPLMPSADSNRAPRPSKLRRQISAQIAQLRRDIFASRLST